MAVVRTDNQLIAELILLLNEQFAFLRQLGAVGYDRQFIVQQKNQPTLQGTPAGPAVFLEKLFDTRHGFPKTIYRELADDSSKLLECEQQIYTTTFQLSARVMQFPGVKLPTASDVLSTVASALQSKKTVDRLQAVGVGVFRVTGVLGNGYSLDDQDRPEASPSFDLVVTYTRETPIQYVGVVDHVDGNIYKLP